MAEKEDEKVDRFGILKTFVNTSDPSTILIQQMSASAKASMLHLAQLQQSLRTDQPLKSIRLRELVQEGIFSVSLNALALHTKVGEPSRKEKAQGTMYPSQKIYESSQKLNLSLNLLHARHIAFVRRPNVHNQMLLESSITRLHRTLCRLGTEISVAISDPIITEVVNASEEGDPEVFLNTGVKVSVAFRPVLSFGHSYNIETIPKESNLEDIFDVAKRAAIDLQRIGESLAMDDVKEQNHSINGRARIWTTLFRMLRAHAHGRREPNDKHFLLQHISRLRIAVSHLLQAELRLCSQKVPFKKAISELKKEADQVNTMSSTLFKSIVQVRENEAKVRVVKDQSVWQESQQEGVNINFDHTDPKLAKKPIKSASLNCLILRLTDPNVPDLQLQKAFLTTYQSFCSPQKLLSKLIERYDVPHEKADRQKVNMSRDDYFSKIVKPIQLRVFNFMRLWLDTKFSDFDHVLLNRMNEFIEGRMVAEGNENMARQLITRITRSIEAIQSKSLSLDARPSSKIKSADDFLLELPEQIFAEQTTWRFFEIYRQIEPIELLDLAWSKDKLKHRAPHVIQMIDQFNKFALWCKSRILLCAGFRNRSKVYTRFVRIAQILFEMHNFDSLINMISVTNSAAIKRLKFTKEAVPPKLNQDFERIKDLVSHDLSWKGYRQIIHTSKPPILPYLGVYLTDLTFIDEGNPGLVGGLINFWKANLLFNVLAEIAQYQQDSFSFKQDFNVQAAFDQCTFEPEDAHFALSLKIEGRNVTSKDQLVQ